MNLPKIKPQLPWPVALILSATATTAVAVDKETAEHVTVEDGPPAVTVVGHTQTQTGAHLERMGGQFESLALHGEVNYSDLALNLPSNAKVFKQRVHDAAYEVCSRLYQMYPDSTGEDCAYRAERDAMPQVTAAINQAEIDHAESLKRAAR
ncbi:UrcA family protein [Steroidobacter cummioxidans]|uniref:UrcA family protein n=1 Tax=Steroidobacter cummioxidans TaxID=1803913 RepID=UPI000E30C41A|nr:UrcA family protein [Steroidobacter cummioxidans]